MVEVAASVQMTEAETVRQEWNKGAAKEDQEDEVEDVEAEAKVKEEDVTLENDRDLWT